MRREWARWAGVSSRKTKNKSRRESAYQGRLTLEKLEDRTLPATLPLPLINNQGEILPSSSTSLTDAQILIDPMNPQKLVAVASHNSTSPTSDIPGLRIWYSINAGSSWSGPITVNNLLNPNNFDTPQAHFTRNEGASLAFDRLNKFYVASVQNTDNN
ncbi:MAG: hypothetical protein ACKO23_07260, partial [Gemmataceae bacterium]